MLKKVLVEQDIVVEKAPIFVGGGVAHGPKGAVYKVKKINKKVKKLGLFHILSQKNKIKFIICLLKILKMKLKKQNYLIIF